MQLRILFYKKNTEAEQAFLAALQQSCTAESFFCPLDNQTQEQEFVPLIRQLIQEKQANVICSFGYVPALSEVCRQTGLLYFCWITEVPTLAMYAEHVTNECNVFFVADQALGGQFMQAGAGNVFYLPLAPCITLLPEGKSRAVSGFPIVSMVGELQQSALYQKLDKLPEKIKGYLDGMLKAQSHVYGFSFYDKLLNDEFREILSRVLQEKPSEEKCRYMLEQFFFAPQVTYLERERIVRALAEQYGEEFCLYSCAETEGIPGLRQERVPIGRRKTELYLQTLNVSITERMWQCGIPQNVWDVLAAGGILFSNYQPALTELFEPGRDFVLYENERELEAQLAYYREHSEERAAIAANGRQKIEENHTWQHRVKEMLSVLS